MIRLEEEFCTGPDFDAGDVIIHKLYAYRGVVVGWDERCEASAQWYEKNQTQPSRDQPWYHVLVDGADQCTYVAEENLELDRSGKPVEHHLIDVFFEGFEDGSYIRNDFSWEDYWEQGGK